MKYQHMKYNADPEYNPDKSTQKHGSRNTGVNTGISSKKCKVGRKVGNISISQDGGKYWEFSGNTGNSREILGFTGKFFNMTFIYPCL